MNKRLPPRILADHAMWIGDLENAFRYYNEMLIETQKALDIADELFNYKTNFELAIVSSILGNTNALEGCIERLERTFRDLETARSDIEEKTEKSVEDLRASIKRKFVSAKRFDVEEISALLKEQFPRRTDKLTLLISPQYARTSLRTALRNAEDVIPPQVFSEGIFRFTMSSELYRIVAKAYCPIELELKALHQCESVRILSETQDAYYVESESLRLIAGIQREGLISCHYLIQSSRDYKAFESVRSFLNTLSTTFT